MLAKLLLQYMGTILLFSIIPTQLRMNYALDLFCYLVEGLTGAAKGQKKRPTGDVHPKRIIHFATYTKLLIVFIVNVQQTKQVSEIVRKKDCFMLN